MRTWLASAWSLGCRYAKGSAAVAFLTLFTAAAASAEEAGGEAALKVPDLSQVNFLGIDGHKLLLFGIVFCVFGLIFGLAIYSRLKGMAVHKSMRDISELIYETCKTYLFTQGKFLVFLWLFIAVVIVDLGVLAPVHPTAVTLPIILIFSVVGMAGSYGVAWFGIRVNTFANSRTAFAALRRQALPHLSHTARSRHEHRHDAHQRRAADDALYPAVYPRRLRRAMLYRLCYRRIAWCSGVAHRRRHLHKNC